jgi:hypothetical protein
VIAGHGHDLRAGRPQIEQCSPDEALGIRRRRRGVEQVAHDQHHVDGLGARHRDDLGQHAALLIETALSAQRLADMPVGGVEEPHPTPPDRSSIGSFGPPPATGALSEGRVVDRDGEQQRGRVFGPDHPPHAQERCLVCVVAHRRIHSATMLFTVPPGKGR